ncbi:MAG: glycosyltransferase [Deltaproteobacteria bacterium]|nr:glycosyltransferase [Deltaproteobacteria bacterium]
MKKLLLISYHFPPDNAVGGIRLARFAKHLPGFGWAVSVLTVRDAHREASDATRLKDVEGVEIFKTGKTTGIRDIYLKLKATLSGALSGRKVSVAELKDNYTPEPATRRGWTLKRVFISLILLPDEHRNWVWRAAFKAIRLLRQRRVDCVMTSSPPHSTHLAGLIIKKLTRARWVADFRDPWLDDVCMKPQAIRSGLSEAIERWMESMVVKNADAVVVNTIPVRRSMAERYPEKPDGFFAHVPNGIDTDKFRELSGLPKYDVFTITYLGTIYQTRSPVPVFKAISELLVEGKLKAADIAVKLIGNCKYTDGRPTVDVARECGLESIVEVRDFIPQTQALKVMCMSHLLLVLATAQPLAIPAKVYDYIGSGTPILALTEAGATADVINETGSGRCFLNDEIEAIKIYICDMIEAYKDGHHPVSTGASAYDIVSLTGRLAKTLDAPRSET